MFFGAQLFSGTFFCTGNGEAYPAGLAVLVLAVIVMARGAAARGTLLLIGAPVVYFALMWYLPLAVAAVVRQGR